MAVKASASITLSFMVDIKATYRYYKLQASTASAPSAPTTYPPSSSSGWDDAEPRYASGSTNTLYFVDCTVLTNNSFTYSKVSVSSSYEAAKEAYNKAVAAGNTANSANNKIDNLQIGGRNLLRNTDNLTKWSKESGISVTSDSDGWYKITDSSHTNSRWGIYQDFSGYEQNTDYTISVYLQNGSSTSHLSIGYGGWGSNVITGSSTKTKYSYTFNTGSNTAALRIYINLSLTAAGQNFYVKLPKLEKGNKATDWSPAPEDVDSAINAKIASVDVEYYLSTSATSLFGGSWQTTAPEWVNGKYMWSRTKITNGAGTVTYKPSETGTCIAGAKGDTGSTGATGNGVKTIVEQYYKSTSATSLSGGSWSTEYPGWENGKYIWTRSVITYTNNSTTTTDAVCVTGQKGDTGATGKGVKSSAVTYQASTSGTAIPTGTWSTSIPSVEAGSYLWTRTIITYTDNSTTTSYSVSKMGDTGAAGKDGVNGTNLWVNPLFEAGKPQITSIDTSIKAPNGANVNLINKRDHYNGSTAFPVFPGHSYRIILNRKHKSGTVQLQAGIWYTSYVSGQAWDSYIYASSTKVLTDGWEEATYNFTCPNGKSKGCIFLQLEQKSSGGDTAWYVSNIVCSDITGLQGAKGETGATGATGNGVKSTEITYQAWSNGTSTPTGTWSSSPPATSASKPYLWTRTIITYTDNSTSTSYSVGSTPEGIVVGGRNLALQTKDFTASNQYWSIDSLFRRSVDGDGFTVMSASRTFEPDAYWNRLIPHKYIPVEDMHNGITVSFDFKCDNLSNLDNGCVCSLQTYNASNAIIGQFESQDIKTLAFTKLDKPLSDGIWVRASVVFTEKQLKTHNANYTDDDVSYASVSFQLAKNGSIHFKKIKIEYGNKATDWTPAPEDVDEKIDDASKVATNYIDFTEGTGLVVGDMTSETLGNNVLIDSDSVDIRNGTTVNASFGTTTTIGRPNWFNVCIDNNSVDIRSGKTVNASFGSDNIELAANSATGSIQLCNKIAKLEGRTNGLYISSKHVLSLTSGPNSTLFLGSTGSPLKVGGNSINFAVGDTSLTKNSNYRIYGGRVIYSNSSGSAGTINLSETAANFSFLEIHYGNSNYQLTTRVYSPNDKKVPLFFDYMVNSTTHQILTKKVTISAKSITTDTSYSGYGNIIDGGTIYVGTENSVKIYYVIGFK